MDPTLTILSVWGYWAIILGSFGEVQVGALLGLLGPRRGALGPIRVPGLLWTIGKPCHVKEGQSNFIHSMLPEQVSLQELKSEFPKLRGFKTDPK